MVKNKLFLLIILFVFATTVVNCEFFSELLQPGDISYLLIKDKIDTTAPKLEIFSPTKINVLPENNMKTKNDTATSNIFISE